MADHDKITYGVIYNYFLNFNYNDNVTFRNIKIAALEVVFREISCPAEKITPKVNNHYLVLNQMLSENPKI